MIMRILSALWKKSKGPVILVKRSILCLKRVRHLCSIKRNLAISMRY